MNTRLRYLRLSVTERCSMRCFYCRGCGAPGADAEELSVEDLRFVARCAAEEGAEKVRITGGEPLRRDDLEPIVRAVASVAGIAEVTLTTNGLGLAQRAEGLGGAGLDRVNISLDSLRGDRFERITGCPHHRRVMEGIESAARALSSVKVNVVLLRGENDDEIGDFVRFAADSGVRVRFIERYGKNGAAPNTERLEWREARRLVEREFGRLEPLPRRELSVERAYRVPRLRAEIGFIASATAPPCARCRKLRLRADGRLLPCLFAADGTDVLPLIRRRAQRELRGAMRRVFRAKGRAPRLCAVSTAVNRVGG